MHLIRGKTTAALGQTNRMVAYSESAPAARFSPFKDLRLHIVPNPCSVLTAMSLVLIELSVAFIVDINFDRSAYTRWAQPHTSYIVRVRDSFDRRNESRWIAPRI